MIDELLRNNYQGKIYIKAIPAKFIEQDSVDEQLFENELTPKQIVTFLRNL